MKKSEFKSIVKECLMEILSEGIGNLNITQKQNLATNENKKLNISNSTLSSTKQQNLKRNISDTSNSSYSGNIKNKLFEEERKKQILLKQKKELMLKLNAEKNAQHNPTIKNIKQSKNINLQKNNDALNRLREDHKNVMMSIFEDTAKNLGTSNIDESKYNLPDGASKEQIVVNNSTPEELFGADAANKWAALAFLEEENKK